MSESLAKDNIYTAGEDAGDNCSFDIIHPLDSTEGLQRFLEVLVQLTI